MNRLALLLPVVVLLAACGKPAADSSESPRPQRGAVEDAAVELQPGGEPDPMAVPDAKRGGTITTWGGPFPKSLNMFLDYNSFSVGVSGALFESLVEMHSTEERPVGVLAESWEISEDGKTYTFRLNPAAKWSDGTPITAGDVQFYYDVLMDPKNLTSLFRVDLSRFGRPEVIDERTVRITANESHWKNFWTAAGFMAFPRHAWEGKDFNAINFEFPVVSGPYRLGEVKMNRSIELVRRGDWWGRVKRYNVGKFNFDRIVFVSTEDRIKVLEMLKKGDIDLYPIYTARIWAEQTQFPAVEKNWVIRQEVVNRDPRAFQGMAINMRRPLFQDARVRQALAHLLNRELMNDKLMFNQYFLLNSYYPDLYPGYRNPAAATTPYDPEKARALLAEAGWTVGPDGFLTKDGQRFTLTFLHYDATDLRHLNIFLEDLKKVGIDAKLDIVSRATFTKRVDNKEFDMLWANWGGSRLRDPETLWSSKTADDVASQNYPGVKDAEIDRLIEAQKTEQDIDKRNALIEQIDARLMAIHPYVLMWQADSSKLLYWNKFGTPPSVLPKYGDDRSALAYWWTDPEKERALAEARRTGASLPAQPEKVVFEN